MLRLYEFNQEEERIIAAVYNEFLSEYGILQFEVDVDVTMLTLDEMHELNMDSRQVDSATDVLSFPYIEAVLPFVRDDYMQDINPETGAVTLGEIMICRDIMLEQAKEYNHSESRECAYLTVHGLHHLLGFDHMNDDDKAEMRNGEEKILDKLNYTRIYKE